VSAVLPARFDYRHFEFEAVGGRVNSGTSSPKRPAEERRIRVVIADDNAQILDYIDRLLKFHFDVVGRAGNGRETFAVGCNDGHNDAGNEWNSSVPADYITA
jgi:hypothetical protein